MINMQMMMSMAQQNKTQEHHCCNHNQPNNTTSNTRIIYVPFPQQQPSMVYQPNPLLPSTQDHYNNYS